MSEERKYGEEFESLLVEWNVQFDKLETMMGNADADPMFAYDEVIAGLRRYRPKAKAGNEEK